MSLLEPAPERHVTLAPDPDWWRGAVLYQIYPRSFQDSNGDGIGDLGGIIHRLPHIAGLGVDAIWISPFFRSPMLDFGYDVSNYRDVEPIFGTLSDFDALLDRAHELGLRVLIDLVVSHTAAAHPWFQESRTSRDNAKADWYVWADPKPDGMPPNNWLSIFGGSAWAWDGGRMQYYLHNFLREQPDLNFHSPEVQDAVLDIARFWLDRGVDGFRLDTVNFYFHDRDLRDNPPLDPAARNENTAPAVNPYNFQDHLYDKTQPENLAFLERFRALLDSYPDRTSIGEVGESQRGTEVQAAYTAGGNKLHMCYDFDLLSNRLPDGAMVGEVLARVQRVVTEGWACWAYSNHDVVRHATRWSLSPEALRLYTALLFSLRGSVCLYQGEELGLTEAYVAYEDLQDPYGKQFWPEFRGRDGCRTPLPWNADHPAGGFTDGRPWLPMAVEHLSVAVNKQDADPASTLNFYRNMIAFRNRHPSLVQGDLDLEETRRDLLAFTRKFGDETLYCAFNLSAETQAVTPPGGDWQVLADAPLTGGTETELPGWHATFRARTTRS